MLIIQLDGIQALDLWRFLRLGRRAVPRLEYLPRDLRTILVADGPDAEGQVSCMIAGHLLVRVPATLLPMPTPT